MKRSQVKRYGCVFTCLAARTVHIEIVHELKTDSFIQAFTRFVSRQDSPIEVYSDNETNFKGAETEIKTTLEKLNPDRIDNCLRKHGIKWNFNPPHASHAGGVWERMIRLIHKILRTLLGSQLVDDETLLTLMAEVKKMLNDRPLTPPTSDLYDPEPVTPSKLLLLRPNVCFFLLENQMLSTSMGVNAGSKPSTSQTSSGNVGCGSICQRFNSNRNGSAYDQTYLLKTLLLLFSTWSLAKGSCARSFSGSQWKHSTTDG